MLVESTREFKDLAVGVSRKAGERFEIDGERFAAINATRYGQLVKAVEEPVAVEEPKPKGKRPTKAQLLAEAESLGIEVPGDATNPEIAALIAGAKGE